MFGQFGAEFFELEGAGQISLQQQVTDFLEIAVLGQIMNVVPAVDQAAFLAVDLTDRTVGGNDPFEPLGGNRRRRFFRNDRTHEDWSWNNFVSMTRIGRAGKRQGRSKWTQQPV